MKRMKKMIQRILSGPYMRRKPGWGKTIVSNFFLMNGLSAITIGAWKITPWLGWIVAGVSMLMMGLLVEMEGKE